MKRYGDMNERGDAIMVTSVILLSIFLSVGSNYLLEYGEIVGKETDMEHVTDLEESFLRMRMSMNSLISSRDTDTMIINRVTLGTPGNPYLTVARSSGVLTNTPDPGSFHLEMVVKSATGSEEILNSLSGAIYCESNNYYFHDQTYYFTAGGIVLDQYGSEVMSSHPDITLSTTDRGYSLQCYLYGVVGKYWKISGIESLPLKVSMAGYSDIERDIDPDDTLTLRINGIGEKAWHDHMDDHLTERGLTEGSDFVLHPPADWDDPTQKLEIDLLGIDTLFARIGEMEVEQ